MNISKREKYLIGILLTVLICFVYYQFIYTKQVGKLATKRAEKIKLSKDIMMSWIIYQNLILRKRI